MPKQRRSTRKVRRIEAFGFDKTLYVHGHGEIRSGTIPISLTVPQGVYVCLATGPGAAITSRLGDRMMKNRPIAINTQLAWIDRPGQPLYKAGDAGRTRNLRYPMSCPNYTLLAPLGLEDLSERKNVFQTDKPITFREIVNANRKTYDIIVWTNCTVLRGPKGELLGPIDDLGDP